MKSTVKFALLWVMMAFVCDEVYGLLRGLL